MGRVPNKWRCFTKALVFTPRGVYTPKKWLSIFTFIDGFPPSYLIVFCRSPPGICAVSTKKRDVSFHYEEQVSPVQGTSVPYWPQWSFYSALMKELSFLNYPLLSTQIILWDFSNHRALYPGCFDSLRWGMSQINSACIKLQCGSQTCIPQMFTAKTRVKGFMESMTGWSFHLSSLV